MSFYGNLEKCYKIVPQDGGIETLTFLEASRVSILPLLDILGKNAFAMVRMDVNGNIVKLMNKYNERPEAFRTLTAIVDHEIEQNTTNDNNSATDALIWLTRGLNFICIFIQNLLDKKNDGDDIKPCISGAYDITLRKHHNWFIQKAVQVAFRAAPYYSDLMRILQGEEKDKDVFLSQVKGYHTLLKDHVNAIQEIYTARGLDPKPLT
ncbi:glycolipid transfer protein-like [Lytechinus variegatus]|uniref:glycolipid transfer protein-like n=1 Tax=Lytechinus variegatus TaxID=7654 RepID=UPI001BB2ADB0|nr:glycolipid transfer protein-like [Lytechinus variegatus]